MLDLGNARLFAESGDLCCTAKKQWCRVLVLDQGYRERVASLLLVMFLWPVVERSPGCLSESDLPVVARFLVGPGLNRVEARR